MVRLTALLSLALASQEGPIVLNHPGPITGVVVDEEGRPVEGVEVFAMPVLRGEGRPLWKARTDAAGNFEIVPPPDAEARYPGRILGSLAAYRPSSRPARESLTARSAPFRLVLRPAPGASVRVLGPDDRPVVGARVSHDLGAIPSEFPPPETVRKRHSAVTDREGRATLADVAPEDLRFVVVETPELGRQLVTPQVPEPVAVLPELPPLPPPPLLARGRRLVDEEPLTVPPPPAPKPDRPLVKREEGPPGERLLKLKPVGRLVGRVVADGPQAWRDLSVRVFTSAASVAGSGAGLETATIDADGRFEIPALAEGRVFLMVRLPEGSTYWEWTPSEYTIKAGETTEAEVRLERGVLVRGLVRERGTDRPVQGAEVFLMSKLKVRSAITDADGRFLAAMPPGDISGDVFNLNPYLAAEDPPFRKVEVPAGAETFDLPPIEILRGADLRGTVRGESGEPAARAEVAAYWITQSGREHLERTTATADDQGVFRVEGLPADAEVWVSARLDEAATGPDVVARPDDPKPIALTLSRENTMSLGGRIVDELGQPIAGAEVRVSAEHHTPDGRFAAGYDSAGPMTTDADGRYETPRILRRDEFYRVSASMTNRRSQDSGRFAPTTPSFFDLALPAEPPEAYRPIRKLLDEAKAASNRGDTREAFRIMGEILEAQKRLTNQDPLHGVQINNIGADGKVLPSTRVQDAAIYEGMAEIALGADAHELSEHAARGALEIRREHLDADHPDVVKTLVILADACTGQNKLDEALRLNDEARALQAKSRAGYPYQAWLLAQRGNLLLRSGRPAEAEASLREAQELTLRFFGEPNDWLGYILELRAWAARETGRLEEAEAFQARAIENGAKIAGADSMWMADALDRHAAILRKLGRDAEADADEARARAIRERREARETRPAA